MVEFFSDQAIRNLQIVNSYGQAVQYEITPTLGQNSVKISGLRSGVYCVRASDGVRNVAQKLVVR